MKVFIENEAGKAVKNIFDEKTLVFQKSDPVSVEYPYPYGFVMNTAPRGSDCLDCFVLADQSVKMGETLEADVIGLMEVERNGKLDHKVVIARLGNSYRILDQPTQDQLAEFVHKLEGKRTKVTRFLSRDETLTVVEEAQKLSGTTL